MDLNQLFLLILSIGALGLAWGTLLAPGAGWILALRSFPRPSGPAPVQPVRPLEIEVLVAAHNEQAVILETLRGIAASAARLSPQDATVSITVGCDHCTDETVKIVEEFARTCPVAVRALANPGHRGKWNLIGFLVGQSRADWVALVDSGAIWREELLLRAIPLLNTENVIGLAPSYSPAGSGLMERLNWKLERFLKRLENRAGGPVSVHGASVFYRRAPLTAALKTLGELSRTEWLTDDVAIPLALRYANPGKRIAYLSEGADSGWVTDIGIRGELDIEYRRRGRMIVGNLQWIRLILMPRWRADAVVTALASRRVFRVLWAYWLMLMAVGSAALLLSAAASLLLPSWAWVAAAMSVAAVLAAATRSPWIRRLSMAFVSGLQIPRHWRSLNKNGGVAWL